MRKLALLCLGALSVALVGCNEVDIVDGRIPAEYLDQSRAVTGTYSGQMEGRAVALTLALDGDRMVLRSSPDLIGDNCNSIIGNLLKVKVDNEDGVYTVEGGKFAFDPNNCGLIGMEGRELELGVRERNGRIEMTAQLLDRTEWRQECHTECTPMPTGGMNCQQRCDMVPYTTYLTGRFVKTN